LALDKAAENGKFYVPTGLGSGMPRYLVMQDFWVCLREETYFQKRLACDLGGEQRFTLTHVDGPIQSAEDLMEQTGQENPIFSL